ncbi:penicillin acylase family protein [Flavobacterium franklandianum]|uniref:Penicillin acylase family protein n=1 Tax=Flavobacterium franklandianum TaxID=2594430 RepID=A0A553CL06_9FLAO|nr:penicillin acylase family protein [Flavobacterium franklandianum]TRX21137.1 penicillin acylase family protein [Flavobacterium franklandianum]
MKIFKKILLVILTLILILVLALVVYYLYSKPTYEGAQKLKNIQKETTVYFDDFGVPHIYASSQKDAMTALGYVHAQDRLWQMELLRRIAPGRLSEMFGSKLLKTDQFFAGLGIDENSEKAITKLDKNSEGYELAMAYIDGINQYMEEGKTPIEFQILGLKKDKFTLKDVYNIFGYMSFSFAMAQKTDPLLTDIRNKLGLGYLKDFGLDGSFGKTQIKNFDGKAIDYSEISKSVASLLDNSPVPAFIGSNSWVIAPQKTKNGKVIFANDPHIAFSQPCTWYEAHIVVPDYEIYGYYLAGTPFPLLAHNRDYAYGLTMFENDDLDMFQEEDNPKDKSQYKTANGFQNYTIRKETIKVKDSSDVVLEVRETQHGPIMNDLLEGIKGTKPVAMSWIYTQQNNQILEAVYSLSHSKNLESFRKGVSLIAAPGLNIMYGDAKGNIAWNTSGKLYKLDKSVNSNFILNGTNGIDDRKKFQDFSINPHAINPSWNYIYSANNQPEAVDGYLYPGYYLPQDRAKRISSLLQPKSNWTKEEVGEMLNDNTSSITTSIAANLISALDSKAFSSSEKQAISILKKWNGSNNLKDIAPTIYQKWIYNYLKNTFQDELGETDFNMLLSTHIVKQIIEPQSRNESSIWWDDVATKNKKETRAEILNKSFHEAISALENQLGKEVDSWTWNRVHTLEHQHPLGQVAALRSVFNVGPFEVPGSTEVINNLFFNFTNAGEYQVKGGPSTRRVIDFSDIENSMSILPTGQSGNPFSKHYNDQAEMYNTGKFRKMKLNKEEIIKTSTKLVFIPK